MVNMIKVPAGMFSVDRSLPINYLGPSAFILEEAISKNGFWFNKPEAYKDQGGAEFQVPPWRDIRPYVENLK